jgi:predicted Zn-dependent peptidase
MADGMQRDWRELCVAVTNESDSTRLSSLAQELIEALDRAERRWRHPACSPDAIATNREAAKEVWRRRLQGPQP